MRFERLLTAVIVLMPVSFAWPQTPAPNPRQHYDPRVTFAPLTLPDPVNAYRSSNGAPGPAYWQNQADYEMHAALDTQAKTLTTTRSSPTPTTAPTRSPACGSTWNRTSIAKIRAATWSTDGYAAQETRTGQRGEPQRAHTEGYRAGLGRDRARARRC